MPGAAGAIWRKALLVFPCPAPETKTDGHFQPVRMSLTIQFCLFQSNQNVSGIDGGSFGSGYCVNGSCCRSHDFVLHFHSFQNYKNISCIDRLTRRNFYLQNRPRHWCAYRACSACGSRCGRCLGSRRGWCRRCSWCSWCRSLRGRCCCAACFFHFNRVNRAIYCYIILFHFVYSPFPDNNFFYINFLLSMQSARPASPQAVVSPEIRRILRTTRLLAAPPS